MLLHILSLLLYVLLIVQYVLVLWIFSFFPFCGVIYGMPTACFSKIENFDMEGSQQHLRSWIHCVATSGVLWLVCIANQEYFVMTNSHNTPLVPTLWIQLGRTRRGKANDWGSSTCGGQGWRGSRDFVSSDVLSERGLSPWFSTSWLPTSGAGHQHWSQQSLSTAPWLSGCYLYI